MRYSAAEKLEIIRLVERSHLPAKQTLGHCQTNYAGHVRPVIEDPQAAS